MRNLIWLLLIAQSALAQVRPVSTFSIVARDPRSGDIGVVVQSHWFAVGQIVPWAEAGVGAVATQSFVDPSYGQLGLDLLRAGKTAPDALRGLLGSDVSCEVRQVAMVDASGNVATFTGARDIQSAGGTAGGSGFQMEPAWRELTPRLPRSALLPDDARLIERIIGAGRK